MKIFSTKIETKGIPIEEIAKAIGEFIGGDFVVGESLFSTQRTQRGMIIDPN